jgi:hypothetical protein
VLWSTPPAPLLVLVRCLSFTKNNKKVPNLFQDLTRMIGRMFDPKNVAQDSCPAVSQIFNLQNPRSVGG